MSSSRKFLLEMACLRSVWRRTNLLPRQFWMLERPVLRANKDDTGTDCLNSSPLTRGVHSQARRLDFLLERKKHTSFARPLGPGFFLCRHMSSKPGECSNKIDCNPAVVEELVPEESLEAVVTQVISVNEAALAAADSSLPVAAIQHFIDSVHAFTGFNWFASIVLSTFLVRGLYIPTRIKVLKTVPHLVDIYQHLGKSFKVCYSSDRPFRIYRRRNKRGHVERHTSGQQEDHQKEEHKNSEGRGAK
ncbi:PREDICTED: mitochondrial inner membrane protein OXA1-like isoform X1 [Tarenaya hassleriana]|uniref:mitochondrial inner membrane protein OXA1-like isoform X1 n=2 Tax=Tarenaya hassleriana TaxID=28532 RepID=UPI00053C3623|nr:PREDICTED: mitochondrial inner membrane protein OXA1-like isoform X1 [Tarenaya hassleriana]